MDSCSNGHRDHYKPGEWQELNGRLTDEVFTNADLWVRPKGIPLRYTVILSSLDIEEHEPLRHTKSIFLIAATGRSGRAQRTTYILLSLVRSRFTQILP